MAYEGSCVGCTSVVAHHPVFEICTKDVWLGKACNSWRYTSPMCGFSKLKKGGRRGQQAIGKYRLKGGCYHDSKVVAIMSHGKKRVEDATYLFH
eukprot:1156221-Pelagomonas_calceolata.AAC.14